MIFVVLMSVIAALCLLAWSGVRIIQQIRARQQLDLTYCLAFAFGLIVPTTIMCLALQVVGGLSHSEAAKSQADIGCMIVFIVLVVLPAAGLLRYRHRHAGSPEGVSTALEGEERQRWRDTINEALMDKATVKGLKKLAIAAIVCGSIVALFLIVWKVPGPLLSFAARNGNTNLAALLLDAGCSVDRMDDRGRTPLMHAAKNGHTEMARLLLDKGADLNVARGGTSALFFAIESGRGDLVDLLLQRGADINFQERYGSRPLPFAGQYGSAEVVQALLKHGADMNARDDIGRTALMRASLCNRLEVVDVLLKGGADTSLRDRDGKTALSLRWSGTGPLPHDPIVQLLIRYGATQ